MPLAYYRLSPTMFVRLMITIWTAYIVAFVPNYQKAAYQNTPARDYGYYDSHGQNNAGYPAGEGYPVIKSADDIKLYDNYVIEIEAENLQETHLYEYLLDGKMFMSPIGRLVNNNLSDYGIGQYYIATLASGEKLLLLLDDTAISIPHSGKFTLPVGKTCRAKSNRFYVQIQEKYQLTEDEIVEYVDMAGHWRDGEQIKQMEKKKTYLYLGTMAGMVLLQILLHVVFSRKMKAMTDVIEK